MKLFLLASLLLLAACGPAEKRVFVTLGTGSQTGVYYPVGGAIKQIVEAVPDSPLRVSVAVSGGSVQNINDVMSGSVTFGIAQADIQYQAFHGQGPWEGRPQRDLRFVFSLHPEVVTLIAAEDSGIRGLADLRGKRVNLGSPGSGQRANATDILRAAGIDPEKDLQAESMAVGECASMLQDNRIDAYFYTVGHPNGSITEASTGRRKVRFVPITGMEALLESAPYFSVTEVPADLYPQALQEGPVPSIGMRTTLVTRANVPDEIVAALHNAVLANLDALKQQHPALQALSPESMREGAHAPVHNALLRTLPSPL